MLTALRHRIGYLIASTICSALLIYRSFTWIHKFANAPFRDDFNHYYATAYLVLNEGIPYNISFFGIPQFASFRFDPLVGEATNPPLLALLTAPLAFFPPVVAWWIWELLIFCSLILCLFLAIELFGTNWSRKSKILAALMFLSSQTFFSNLILSQVQAPLLLLVLVGYKLLKKDKLLGAFLWGISIPIKLYTWPLLLIAPLAHSRNPRRAFEYSLGGLTVGIVLPALLLGPSVYAEFFHGAIPVVENTAIKMPHNISYARALLIDALLVSQLIPTGIWLSLAFYLPPCIIFSWLTPRFVSSLRGGQISSTEYLKLFVAAITVAFFSAPVAWDHYMIVLLLPFIFIWDRYRSPIVAVILFGLWLYLFQRPYPYSYMPGWYDTFYEFTYRGTTSALILMLALWTIKSRANIHQYQR